MQTTLTLEDYEVFILMIILTDTREHLEQQYKEGANTPGFMKNDALSQINDLKDLIKKVDNLMVWHKV